MMSRLVSASLYNKRVLVLIQQAHLIALCYQQAMKQTNLGLTIEEEADERCGGWCFSVVV